MVPTVLLVVLLPQPPSAGEPTCPNCWKVAGHPGPCGSDD